MTAGSVSNIDGLIRANSAANLFLLNPNGIVFGPNAELSIGGSFVGSTASSLNFADGTSFSATAPQSTPLLTVSVPIGLQFGPQAGGLRVQGPGAVLDTDSGLLLNREAGLSVQPSETLALVGAGIALEGGILTTDGGRIELGSIVGPGLVSLTPIDSGWALGYESIPTFRDIRLSGAAAVDASGSGGGDIHVRGRRLTVTDGSQIKASTLGSEPGGTLNVITSESVEVIGKSADDQFSSGLNAQVYPGATGAGGNLTVETGQLSIRDGAQVLAGTRGTGAGGTLSVTAADAIELIGTSADGRFSSGLYASTTGEGDAGDLTIATGRLSVGDGAVVSVTTFSTGAGGTLSVTAADAIESLCLQSLSGFR